MTSHTRRILYRSLVGLCFAVGIASRFYGAWACRYIRNPDTGIVALMVKHMVEGREWPVFFYGQAYMGTLEPMLSVLVAFVIGISGLAVCLGTALAAIASLPVIFAWGRDAGGKTAGLAALALCAVGPYYYFMFQFAARGGYTVTLLLGLLVMWLSARTAVKLHARRDGTSSWFLLIGLLAGLGWWTNQLIAPALGAAAVVLAVGLRGRVWARGPWIGLIGFIAGSLPFWVWNLQHGGASFNMFSSVGGIDAGAGLQFLWERYARLVGLQDWPPGLRRLVLLAYPAGMGLGLLELLVRFRLRRLTRPAATGVTLGVFVALSILTFVRSSFATMNTARYLVPLVPAGAILFGAAIARLRTWTVPPVAALPVLLLAASHWLAFPELQARNAATDKRRARDAELGRFLQRHAIEAAYSHFMDHALNFNLDEAVVVTDMRGDRYPPYSRRAELAEQVAVVRNHGHIAEFPGVAGGTMRTTNAGGYGVRYDFTPPAGGLTDITATQVARIVDRSGRDCTAALTDGNIDTDWIGRHDGSTPEWIEVHFDPPVSLRRLRVQGMGTRSYPARARVDVRTPDRADWDVFHAPHRVTDYYWSGPRPYWGGRRQRLEYRFDDSKVAAVRLVALDPRGPHGLWQISELQCFAPGPDSARPRNGWPALRKTLAEGSIRTLYCDRWVANRVFSRLGTTPRVELVPSFFPETGLHGGSVEWRADAAVLLAAHDLPAAQSVLNTCGLHWTEDAIAPWILLRPAPSPAGTPAARHPDLYWTGTRLVQCSEMAPRREARVSFPNGVTLVGLTVHTPDISPGRELELTWFWHVEAPENAQTPFVFVHFVHGDEVFQDDHKIFDGSAMWRTTSEGHARVRDRRFVRVPADAGPGPWNVELGLYLPSYGKRLRPVTDLPTHRRAVSITNAFSVAEGSGEPRE